MRRAVLRAALGIAAGCAAAPASAEDLPLWEAGAGLAAVDFPDYRGSSQSRGYLLPLPYLIYRGRIFKADRQGVRSVLFDSDRVDLNMSLAASPPVDSSRDRAREGMQSLRPTLELGPVLDLTLWQAPARDAKLQLRVPVRGAMTVEAHPRFIGGELVPQLTLDVIDPFGQRGWNLGLVAGTQFADARYHRYFYEVTPADATPERPAYHASGGYAGTDFIVALSKRFTHVWVGAFARYDGLRGATFASSPLVTSKSYAAVGLGVSWIFHESSERVSVDPLGERQ